VIVRGGALVVAVVACVGCSAHGASSEAGPERGSATTVDVRRTTPGLRLGHYTTRDSRDGFVLDRLTEPWLIRRDGTSDVLRLVQSNQGADWIDYAAGDLWIRVYTSGWEAGRILYDGPAHSEGVDAVRDADADPLR